MRGQTNRSVGEYVLLYCVQHLQLHVPILVVVHPNLEGTLELAGVWVVYPGGAPVSVAEER